MPADPAALLAGAAAVLALAALGLCLLLLRRQARLLRAYDALVEGGPVAAAAPGAPRTRSDLEGVRADVLLLRDDLAAARADLASALRHVAVVRYDAFGDLGGRMSFSAALLDDAGDGLVLTSINGRSEGRTYAKGVQGAASDVALSPEEHQAVAQAVALAASRGAASGGRRLSRA